MSDLSPLIGMCADFSYDPKATSSLSGATSRSRYAGPRAPCCLKVEAIFNWRLVASNNDRPRFYTELDDDGTVLSA